MAFNYKDMNGGFRDAKVVLRWFSGFDCSSYEIMNYENTKHKALAQCMKLRQV